jgi:hypothetical protein
MGAALWSGHVGVQVFDRRGGVLTGKGERGAAPMGFWGLALSMCLNERDREGAWSQAQGRIQIDVAGAGWGWLGSAGARERGWLRLGNTRGAEKVLRTLAWSERQRGSGELEVGCLGGCQSKVEERG